jgi:hypothetical protein
MINENEYYGFIKSVAEFVTTVLQLHEQQKQLNISQQHTIDDLTQVLHCHQVLLKECRDQNLSFKTFIAEHESRLLCIEKCLREETIYRGYKLPNCN